MPIERHLILQELTLRPSGEWTPPCRGWTVARVAEGAGYWLQGSQARELNVGDGFVTAFNAKASLRASQLGPLKLQFFTVQPQFLNGLLTVAETHQLEFALQNPPAGASLFTASEALGQKFTRLAAPTHNEGLPKRCALLQLWTSAVANLFAAPATSPPGGNKLRERFRELVGQLSERELSESSLADLAAPLHCSERHFNRLFREEFGVSFRARQIELRLQRAQQLLLDSDAKIINVAYESGYRHLGLFNAMFKKKFGMTPGEWRQSNSKKNNPTLTRGNFPKLAGVAGIFIALFNLFLSPVARAQTNTEAILRAGLLERMRSLDEEEKKSTIHIVPATTNGPHFRVDKYLVTGNSILTPGAIGEVITNVPAAFGTNVSLDAIRAALGDLQMAYRERGFVTVSVGLPQQKLTNAEVKVKVTEGRLAAINVTGNRWYSSNNVMSALPSLYPGMLLNSHVFQRELDLANASRDRQIYPVIGPGLEPGTSELTLKVKDRFPLHARLEVNNQATPGSPDLRANFSSQYDNLWGIEHQVGIQYSFSFNEYKAGNNYQLSPFDTPLIANYSAYYRMPLGRRASVQSEVDANPSSFGFDELTRKFRVPPPTDRATLTVYGSRSVSDTGVQFGGATNIVRTPLLTIDSVDTGENITLNEGLGARLSAPLPAIVKMKGMLTFGFDFKRYKLTSNNTNNFPTGFVFTNQFGPYTNSQTVSSPQPSARAALDYLPLSVGLNTSVPDDWGTTFLNANVNFNVFSFLSDDKDFARASYTTNIHSHYVTVQAGASREQKIYKDWTVLLHADGQWANGPLFGNEQYALGGTTGVRGYSEGESYGDSGWRVMIEPRSPLISIGMVDGNVPFWVRNSVFVDYGETYLLEPLASSVNHLRFLGAGWSLTASIGSHLDARLMVAFPLISTAHTPMGAVHIYFGVGAQF